MRKILTSGLVAGVVLLVLAFIMLQALPFIPVLADEYFNAETFRTGATGAMFYYLHPFVFALAMAWFWDRFKGLFTGNFMLRGLEVGLVYGIVAMLPTMWITYSAINVSFPLVASWFVYGVVQAIVAGEVCARMNP